MDVVLGNVAVALVVLLPLVWPSYKFFRSRRRRNEARAVATFAGSRGWGFSEEDNGTLHDFQGEPVMADERRGWNFVWGGHGDTEFVAFDLELIKIVETRSFDFHVPRDRTVVAVRLPQPAPYFSVRPEQPMGGGFLKLAREDLDLELEEFNRAFFVAARDRRFAVYALPRETMDLLLEIPAQSWNCYGWWIACVSHGRMATQLEYLELSIERAARFAAAIPPFAWEPTPEVAPE